MRHAIEIETWNYVDVLSANAPGYVYLAPHQRWWATVYHDDGKERIYEVTPDSLDRIIRLCNDLEERRLYHDPGFEIMRRALASREDAPDAK